MRPFPIEENAASPSRPVLAAAWQRFRMADSFTSARALAFQLVMSLLSGVIVLTAVAARLGEGRVQALLQEVVTTALPSGTAGVFFEALKQGTTDATRSGWALAVGVTGVLVTAVLTVGQLRRAVMRIHGREAPRLTTLNLTIAATLGVFVGLAVVAAVLLLTFGQNVGTVLTAQPAGRVGELVAWAMIVGLGAIGLGVLLMVVLIPNPPTFRASLVGASVAVGGGTVMSMLLGLYLNASGTFGEIFGSLAGLVGGLFWAQLNSIVLLFSVAISAELHDHRQMAS